MERFDKIIQSWENLYKISQEDNKRLEAENKMLQEQIKKLQEMYQNDTYCLKEQYSKVLKILNNH